MIAEIENLENESLKDFLKQNDKENLNFLALDEITDPRNIGSIIRSAVSFNMDGILVKERSFPSNSKLLYKSGGGVEHIRIFKVSNLNTALRFLKLKNFGLVLLTLIQRKILLKIIGKEEMCYYLVLKDKG